MTAQLTRQLSGIPGLYLEHGSTELRYLDRARKNRLVIVWNGDAGRQLCRLSDSMKRGRGGTVLLGALSTDARLFEPKTVKGTYLLRFVLPAASRKPYLDLVVPDGSGSYALPSHKDQQGHWFSSGYDPQVPPTYGRVSLRSSTSSADQSAFPFEFKVLGLPDDKSTIPVKTANGTRTYLPYKIWAEGWIRVEEP